MYVQLNHWFNVCEFKRNLKKWLVRRDRKEMPLKRNTAGHIILKSRYKNIYIT